MPGDFAAFVRWMPEDRARRVVREEFEADRNNPDSEPVSDEAIKKAVKEFLDEHGIGDRND